MAPNAKHVFYVRYLPSAASYMAVLAQRPDVQLEKLETDSPEDAVSPVVSRAHVYQIGASRQIIPPRLQVNAALLARMPNLIAASSNGAGYDTIDVDACTAAGVAVVNQSGGNKEAVAEHALAMMMTLSKRIVEADRHARTGQAIDRANYIGRELNGRTLGVIGIGNVGGNLARMCKAAFNMRILAYDPLLTAQQVAARGAEKVELDDLLAQSDYVSVHCPLTKQSRGMMGAAQFARMKPEAYFITTARGFIHDEAALADALKAKRIAGAGLDVWEDEPPPHDHPLMAFDTVMVSPHVAGSTIEARENMGRIAAEQVLAILDGKKPPRLINPEVWPAYRDRFTRILGFAPEE
ncbi:NAD(P)-dependent oxidoreductase [Rhodopila sp.]|jgi:D-3-phosphoglycerate dehydrogenase|uniref:NAD(P)-dependent oxidoreductase n=1 Tax=Rhodopila sp. TaxID=2480087 RepID=UPI002B82D4A5|nr:NAD(P)-dependent oxidoreductase [Rhodopila sp.]HVZ09569.1 NAD(P)-dependent oxidoreductase [Rhodopila sp.]